MENAKANINFTTKNLQIDVTVIWSVSLVRTNFGLDPAKTGLGSGPASPNNKFVECGRKN